MFTKFEDKSSPLSDLVFFYLTSLKNSPGFNFKKWKDDLDEVHPNIRTWMTSLEEAEPGKTKGLVRCHKPSLANGKKPYRLLLCGTSSSLWANLSKDSIKHLISKLKYKARDTKLIHQIIMRLNRTWQAAKQVGCDVQKLYPSVENNVWIPAVRRMLERYPNPEFVPTDLIIEALEICLEENFCEFCNDYFKVNSGTAMGPCHSCD